MRFYIVDDDPAVRYMLEQIIEDEDLGSVVGEAEDGAHIDSSLLAMKHVNIVLIDLLMPIRDGIATVRELSGSFDGKIVMISQVESKDLIGKAYSFGIEYYITKPINRLEVIAILRKVTEGLRLQRSIKEFQKTLSSIGFSVPFSEKETPSHDKSITTCGNYVLSDLGLIGEAGSKDLLDILEYLYRYEASHSLEQGFPQMLDIYQQISRKKLGPAAAEADLKKEIKAAEQRVRRTVNQALTHLASLGLIDYANPKFEQYAAKFFDLSDIRKKMKELENDEVPALGLIRQNTKKFIQVLYLEAKKLMG